MLRMMMGVGCLIGMAITIHAADENVLKPNPLTTKWATDVDPDHPLPEYPRPQLVREEWQNLNGRWDYAITPKDRMTPPDTWDGKIVVPFPVESKLSGVQRTVGPNHVLWYRRTFSISEEEAWSGKRILLQFGAVDWDTTVWINDQEVGQHRGGYDPFTLDITEALGNHVEHEMIVRVFDPSDAGYQPRGKQVQKSEGIWYTPTTGIWQTVWLEPVETSYIRGVTFVADIDTGVVNVSVDVAHPQPNGMYDVQIGPYHNFKAAVGQTAQISLSAPNEKQLWTPQNPNLQSVKVSLFGPPFRRDNAGRPAATWSAPVKTYFAWRKISLGKDDQGVTRLFLNNKPYFQMGPLDQGFWPDGLYTAPTDEALKFDIEMTKQYGFNLIRKHVKVEPARWYYWCDKLGMLVWQDMPSGDKSAPWDPFGKHDGEEITRTTESAENFRAEWKAIIDALKPFPCIVMWVPFNEAWGQFDTVAVSQWTKEYDPTRLINCASGGNDFPVGDVVDVHRYPGPFAPKPEANRAAVLGEFGGLGLPIEGHTWLEKGNWGYKSFTDQPSLTEAYLKLIEQLKPMIENEGLSAAIYTQTTDVEIEVNGLMTYDRKVQKIPVDVLSNANQGIVRTVP